MRIGAALDYTQCAAQRRPDDAFAVQMRRRYDANKIADTLPEGTTSSNRRPRKTHPEMQKNSPLANSGKTDNERPSEIFDSVIGPTTTTAGIRILSNINNRDSLSFSS